MYYKLLRIALLVTSYLVTNKRESPGRRLKIWVTTWIESSYLCGTESVADQGKRCKVTNGYRDVARPHNHPCDTPTCLAVRETKQDTLSRTRSRVRGRRLGRMARNPFVYDRDASHDEDSEFGFGRGHHPDPNIDYSDGGIKSRIPIADPTAEDQQMTMQMLRRMDINDPNDQPSPYVAGNTDRYGAQPPLVRETRRPKRSKQTPRATPRMRREW